MKEKKNLQCIKSQSLSPGQNPTYYPLSLGSAIAEKLRVFFKQTLCNNNNDNNYHNDNN